MGKTALLIEGVRRVGKSFAVAEFYKHEYRRRGIIDFSNPPPINPSEWCCSRIST